MTKSVIADIALRISLARYDKPASGIFCDVTTIEGYAVSFHKRDIILQTEVAN